MVSAAAGATGSIAGQVAKIAGARWSGIAGGPRSAGRWCRTSVLMLVSTTRTTTCRPPQAAVPQGRQRLLRQRRRRDFQRGARPTGPEGAGGAVRGDLQLSHRRASRSVQSASTCSPRPQPCRDSTHLRCGPFREAFADLRRWGAEGNLNAPRDRFRGLESCVDALNGLFTRSQHRQDAGEGQRPGIGIGGQERSDPGIGISEPTRLNRCASESSAPVSRASRAQMACRQRARGGAVRQGPQAGRAACPPGGWRGAGAFRSTARNRCGQRFRPGERLDRALSPRGRRRAATPTSACQDERSGADLASRHVVHWATRVTTRCNAVTTAGG